MKVLRMIRNTPENTDLLRREQANLRDGKKIKATVRVHPGSRYVQLVCSDRNCAQAAEFLTDLAYATGRTLEGLTS